MTVKIVMNANQIIQTLISIKRIDNNAVVEYMAKADTVYYDWCYYHEIDGMNISVINLKAELDKNSSEVDVMPINDYAKGYCITIHDEKKKKFKD